MTRQQELRSLEAGSTQLGTLLTREQQDLILRYLDLLYIWNRTAGLTTIPREAAIRLHVLDSLAAQPFISAGPCLDLGTGAGLPGLVLAIALPRTRFELVESNRRKCSFLLEVVRELALPNVSIVQADANALPQDRKFPVVISRAFRQPPEFLTTAAGLVTPSGRIILMMADPGESELLKLADGAELSVEAWKRFFLPEGGEPRTLASFVPKGRTVSRETGVS